MMSDFLFGTRKVRKVKRKQVAIPRVCSLVQRGTMLLRYHRARYSIEGGGRPRQMSRKVIAPLGDLRLIGLN